MKDRFGLLAFVGDYGRKTAVGSSAATGASSISGASRIFTVASFVGLLAGSPSAQF